MEPDAEYVDRNDDEWADEGEPNTFPSGATAESDRRDAARPHQADRQPTPEELAAIEGDELDPKVASAYEDANKRGANVKGEGQID